VTYLTILLVNILILYSLKTDKRYWIVPIPLWTILVLFFILWKFKNDKVISQLDTAYWQSADYNKKINLENWRGDEKIYNKLEETKSYVRKYNNILLNSIFLQTILTFISQVIGYKRTSLKKTYKLTSTVFGVLLILNFFLFLLMAITPTGPLV